MADPITIAAGVGMAGTAIGSVVQGFGAKQSADASAAAYTYKAGVALMNRDINKTNANFAIQSGDIKAQETGLEAGQKIAQTKVDQAASGLDVNSGTAAEVRKTQTDVAEFDQGVINWESHKAAWGYEAKAATDEAEANLDMMAADNTEKAGNISMISSFIGGATSVATKWSQAKMLGIGSGGGSGGTGDPTTIGGLY